MRHSIQGLLLIAGLLLADYSLAYGQARPGPFTAPPKSLRSRDVDQQHIRLELKFDFDKQAVNGKARHQLELFRPTSSIQLDAADMKIGNVMLLSRSGTESQAPVRLKHTHKNHQLTIDLPEECPAGTALTLEIDYSITRPKHGVHFVEPDQSEEAHLRMVWTQCEPEYARYWLPCIDAPGDRITSEIIATVPSKYVVLSNGTLTSKTPVAGEQTTWHWTQARSHVPYLMSVVAGEFETLEETWDGIPVVSYVPRGRLPDAKRSFEKTPAMLKYFTQKIGYRYPWPKYAQICVDEYAWGGMEHTSATTLNLDTLHDARAHLDVSSDNLVAHELAHQWWGDLLTCKDWGELWLNESFATYFATLWTEHDKGGDEATWQRAEEAANYQNEDARYRRSIVNYRYNSPENMFDGHSYPKGGRVLHMLRFELGDEMFWKAIRRYCEVNQFRTVETADLRIAVEEATGQGMNWFFDQWAYKGGHPEFNVSWDYDAAAKQVRITIKQTQKVDEITPLFRTSAEIEIASGQASRIRRVTLSKAEETFHFDSPERPTRVCFDPRDWILKKLTAEKGKDELLDQLTNSEYLMCRVQAVRALAAMEEDKDAQAGLSAATTDDKFWAVRQEAVKGLKKFPGDATRAKLIQACSDEKSFVRREALQALAKFSHDDSKTALRKAIDSDQSYYAVAEALKSLAAIDKSGSRELLLKACEQPSHREVILKAAVEALAAQGDTTVADSLTKMLETTTAPERRVAIIGALARLKSGDAATLKLLHDQLGNKRQNVRRSALEAVTQVADATSIATLEARRGQEVMPRMIRSIDESIAKIREKQQGTEALLKEVERLRKQNLQLEERLKKLEEKK
ncbi:Aminopeptidase N [Anatilimnocola aggregata]|uniref:Aminopeptidase N n=1 Tax=Anatilimnocola aggregata TaxID=2528021 RepID=A0A517YG21_9BACT|nr:M1 family aminopeptidase [Anatilimnocola aggregata]QDU29169.1 Aminopeptidase N [Anatilimnocola aggregata]